MARARAHIGETNYRVEIKAGHHQLVADEHPELGGKDVGPAPYEILLAALGACTSITLKMYAQRKDWPLAEVDVGLVFTREGDRGKIERTLTLTGDLDEAQRARLADIAERTPVTLTLKAGADIHTTLA
ncbi:MAG: OsmC family protein [Caulobacteraceae bacterium]|nr:OsmC family protein [Caulobacteraceae bacterium]